MWGIVIGGLLLLGALPSSVVAEYEGEEEVVNIKLIAKEKGGVHMQFQSHGRNHDLHLSKSRVQLNQTPINFLGEADHAEGIKLAQEATLMVDNKWSATVALKESSNGQLEPALHSGFFHIGKHEFEMAAHSPGRARITKRALKEREFQNDAVIYGAERVKGQRHEEVVLSTERLEANVELGILVDYSLYVKFQRHDGVLATDSSSRDADLLLYFAHLAAIMDTSYSTMQNDDIVVTISLAGITVLTTPIMLPDLVENLKNETDEGTYIDGGVVLERLAEMRESLIDDSTVPPNDHLMMFSNYDLAIDGSEGLLGIAYLYQICQNGSASVVEVIYPQSFVAFTASHELAHSLGVGHDGTSEAEGCPDDSYIMSAYAGGDDPYNKFLFSCCSQRSMYYALQQPSAQCLTENNAELNIGEDIINNTIKYLPGQAFNAHAQCYIAYGTPACSDSIYESNGISICQKLYCVKPDDNMLCITEGSPAADGTTCDSEKICYQGSCVAESEARLPEDQNCNVRECFGSERQCTTGMNVIDERLGKCYPKSWHCDQYSDCEDGSDEKKCPICKDKRWLRNKCYTIKVRCLRARTAKQKRKCRRSCRKNKNKCCKTCCEKLGMCY